MNNANTFEQKATARQITFTRLPITKNLPLAWSSFADIRERSHTPRVFFEATAIAKLPTAIKLNKNLADSVRRLLIENSLIQGRNI